MLSIISLAFFFAGRRSGSGGGFGHGGMDGWRKEAFRQKRPERPELPDKRRTVVNEKAMKKKNNDGVMTAAAAWPMTKDNGGARRQWRGNDVMTASNEKRQTAAGRGKYLLASLAGTGIPDGSRI